MNKFGKTVTCAMIAGEDCIEDGIVRALLSMKGKVDNVLVLLTAEDTIERLVKAMGDVDSSFEAFPLTKFVEPTNAWDDDFSAARNRSFYEANRTWPETDWLFWMDCDDILPEYTRLDLMIEQAVEKHAHGVFIPYDYQWDGEKEKPLVTHLKGRLYRADVDWKWVGPIHENVLSPFGTKMTIIRDMGEVRHLRRNHKDIQKAERNARIIKKWYDENNDDPRAAMYMAHEVFRRLQQSENGSEEFKALGSVARQLYAKAIDGFDGSEDNSHDLFTCNANLAKIYQMFGQWEAAIDRDMQGIKMEPLHRSSYVNIALTHLMAGGFNEAVTWAQLALNIQTDHEAIGFGLVNHLTESYEAWMVIGETEMRRGNFQKAAVAYQAASSYYTDDYTKVQLDKAERASFEKGEDFFETKDLANVREQRYGSAPEKSICFFSLPAINVWNPNVLEDEGMGGTEYSIIKLAQRFAADGWRVAIFGSVGHWDNVELHGIEWYETSRFDPDEQFTIFVGLRVPQIFQMPLQAAHKILWMHDVNAGPLDDDAFEKMDMIVCPSPWHCKHLTRLYGNYFADKLVDIQNGFDVEPFLYDPVSDIEKRLTGTVVYASSPDRGLPRLLELWPDIHDLAGVDHGVTPILEIYYGWDGIDSIIESGSPQAAMMAHFKERTEKQIADLLIQGYSINWIGRVPESELSAAFKRASVMAYPADFLETFGIVFRQAAAAGCIPVTSKIAGVHNMYDSVEGAPNNEAFGERFVKKLVESMMAPDRYRSSISSAHSFCADWKSTYETWLEEIDTYTGLEVAK